MNQIRKEVDKLLAEGVHPKEIQRQLLEGLKEIGKKYESGECFIGDLIVSGMMMKEILSMDQMKTLLYEVDKTYTGKVILGTVSEDIHDIGKDIMKEFLSAEGFEVLDLGVDVSPEKFLEAIRTFKPDIVGISFILTTCLNNVFKTISAIENSGLRDSLKIIVGGAAISKKYSAIKGADAYTDDAYEGLKICETWMLSKQLQS
ncbi:cobalamin-dependent protein [Alkalibacter sp. M17DMB]|nr:cobalamin-dependent protein [Alkalibacter mobilis]